MMESDDCINKLPQITTIKHKAWRAYNNNSCDLNKCIMCGNKKNKKVARSTINLRILVIT